MNAFVLVAPHLVLNGLLLKTTALLQTGVFPSPSLKDESARYNLLFFTDLTPNYYRMFTHLVKFFEGLAQFAGEMTTRRGGNPPGWGGDRPPCYKI